MGKRILRFKALALLSMTVVLCGCQEKFEVIKAERDVNKWIYETMEERYLWSSQLPAIEKTDRTVSPVTYFNNYIRFRSNTAVDYSGDTYGDRFSSLTSTASSRSGPGISLEETVRNDFGMLIMGVKTSSTTVGYFLVVYVQEGTPAAAAGVQRGDIIKSINGYSLPLDLGNAQGLMAGNQVEFGFIYPEQRTVNLVRATYNSDPIHYYKVIDRGDGNPAGYLVYNHFTAGNGNRHIRNLEQVFLSFKDRGVKDLILDLRYNGGGELTTSVELASLIAPQQYLGQTFAYLERKNNFEDPAGFEPLPLDADMQPYNISATRLYVLTSASTASASELVIHTLQALDGIQVMVIGDQTVGKNLGTQSITNNSYQWEITPVTVRIHNINKVSGYEEGIPPAIYLNEFGNVTVGSQQYYRVYPFGDEENDPLLHAALNQIYGGPSVSRGAVDADRVDTQLIDQYCGLWEEPRRL